MDIPTLNLNQVKEAIKAPPKPATPGAAPAPPISGQEASSIPIMNQETLQAAFDALKNQPKPDKPKRPENQDHIHAENKRLAGLQYTVPYVDRHKENFVGEARHDDADEVHVQGADGKWLPTDKNKHVVLIDPEDGKLKVYNRSKKTDWGPIMGRAVGLGEGVAEGLAVSGISAGPKTAVEAGHNVNILGIGRKVSNEAGAATEGGTAVTAKGAGGPMNQERTQAAEIADASARLRQNTGVQVDVPMAAATDSPTIERAGQVLAKAPVAGSPLRRGAERMGDALDEAHQATTEIPTGARVGAERAGEVVDKGFDAYATTKDHGVLSQRIKGLYDNVKSTFTRRNVKYQLQETQKMVDDLVDKYDKAGLPMPESVKEVLGPLNKTQGLDYDSLRFVRRRLGEMLEDTGRLPAGVSESELKRLYGALKDDIRNLVNIAGGPRSVAALDRADKYTAAASKRREALADLLGERSHEGIAEKIYNLAGSRAQADAKTLAQAKKSLQPDEWAEVASFASGRLGRVKTQSGDTFAPGQFVKDYTALSDRGRDILFGAGTPQRQALDDLNRLSKRWAVSARNMEGTGSGGVTIDMISTLSSGLLGYHAFQTGEIKHVMTAAAALIGANFVSRILATPAAARAASNWARRYEALRLRPGSSTLAAFNNATRLLEPHVVGQGGPQNER